MLKAYQLKKCDRKCDAENYFRQIYWVSELCQYFDRCKCEMMLDSISVYPFDTLLIL